MLGPALVASLSAAAFAWTAPATADPIAILAQAVALDPDRPDRDRFGRLQWLGSLHLTSPDRRFGGYSGLELAGDNLLAVSDTGHWISFRPQRDAQGRLVGVTGGSLAALLDTNGRPVRGKWASDAESLRRERDGNFLVSFERDHRVWRYAATLDGKPMLLPTPDAMRQLPANGGIEALAVWGDGGLGPPPLPARAPVAPGGVLLLAEEAGGSPLAKADERPAWLLQGGAWRELSYAAGEGFSPTDAAVLANGNLIVLERRYQPLAGVSARIVSLKRAAIVPGASMAGELLAEFPPPLAIDNLEGLALAPETNGDTLIYVISDDNVSPLQRTLLILFRLEP